MVPGQPGWTSKRLFLHTLTALLLAVGVALTDARAVAAEVDVALDKANAYIELTKTTERAVDSWDRYQSWVDVKSGPTGKERYIDYGLYDLYDTAGLARQVRELAAKAPDAAIDTAVARYLTAYEALAPVINEAAAYYDTKGYLSDKLAKGKALHARLVPLATAFMTERQALMPRLRAFVRAVEAKEVGAIEAREGASAVWHVALVMHRLNRVVDLFPRVQPQPIGGAEMDEMMRNLGPDTPGETFDKMIAGVTMPKVPPIDVAAFNDASNAYDEAVTRLDGFKGKPPPDAERFAAFVPMARQMREMLTAFRKPLAASKGEEFERGGQMANQIFGHYIEMLNASNSVGASRLQFLP